MINKVSADANETRLTVPNRPSCCIQGYMLNVINNRQSSSTVCRHCDIRVFLCKRIGKNSHIQPIT